jgi:CheY-like chemotaxis protein
LLISRPVRIIYAKTLSNYTFNTKKIVPQSQEPTGSKLILIGEDDIDDQEFLKEIFSSIDNSFTLFFAGNGVDVLSYLNSCPHDGLPCLIVLDYNMPGLTGVEILEELKKNTRCRLIPKIIWSTSGSQAYKSICLELGANDFLVKPSNVSELTEICRYMLSACVSE